jgi:hypothetical protein
MTLKEGELSFTFNGALSAIQFDDGSTHRLTHCMKAVDFVVEFPDYYLFVEVKDPDNPRAKSKDVKNFSKRLQSGELCNDLVQKYRDSFLYRWAEEKVDKPITYLVLLSMSSLDSAALMHQGKNLETKLPCGKKEKWIQPIATACAIFNIDSWNKQFTQWQVQRISKTAATGV